MQFDNVVIIEGNYRNYYPLSISTPLSDLIIGGLRYYEHVALWLMNLGYDVNIYVITRDYLARYWRGIADSILSRLNLKYSVKYVHSTEDISGVTLWIGTSLIPQIDVLNKLMSNAMTGVEIRCGDKALLSITNERGAGVKDTINNCDLPMADGIWSIIKWNTELLRSNSKYLMKIIGDKAVDSDISSNAVIDERAGNVIAINTIIEPLTYIKGPSLLGPGSRVLPHAYVRRARFYT
ncbi:hypothetical protein [Vulcanisaeta sp. JCM 16159]|uniref:hypothetical protein n=1 Tax=Vulcanisaeta sp. JCM 16159 TaxID=1295371 RepID=UPI0006D21217|nr:hypothetical protein [Vulcanisaeta sp. JCM 16159]